MTQETVQVDDLTKLRQEYDQYCRVLGERTYVLWITQEEIKGLQAKVAELNKKASELSAPKEPSDGK